MKKNDFEDIRPYHDEEVPAAIQRISENVHFLEVVNYLFPNIDSKDFIKEFKGIKTKEAFQTHIMHKVIRTIIDKTMSNFTFNGFEPLNNDISYMFISNHRDIVLDSALLEVALYESGIKTSEITFGSNLMSSQFIIDIGKVNKMFKISRGGTLREIFANSIKVSNYMRYAITEKNESVWIAQRNGRTKDGNDITDMAVLKMFSMSSEADFVPNLMELNITPMVISYEYEPCDFFKTREMYISVNQNYVKQADEDFVSILHGIRQWKGGVNLHICETITEDELVYCDSFPKKEKFKQLALLIDKRIHKNYKLWKTNYIANDLLHNHSKHADKYTTADKDKFVDYMEQNLKIIEGDREKLKKIFLEIYGKAVDNCC
ncbi:acyltransferase [Odoribacter sp. OttesenSCG-928-L07]|nr:acyltransferase [Odoribacter sp. OttesenSCG-928-L07]MDL2238897.1 acyltransferase [Bacteroidales bacterium OttesenSCG-928-L14]MDL2240637.1 acyltransferase [Bacteroidales bacterium OttesenSCG-928-K22]